mmetsp:Transcript_37621/g.95012  ORF Transcript_37621/g.95012 Transcript_37621/m.95012 type:complete len:365 (-) Transcript_37621:599-1693(-)
MPCHPPPTSHCSALHPHQLLAGHRGSRAAASWRSVHVDEVPHEAVRVAVVDAHPHQLAAQRQPVAVKVHELVVADAAKRLARVARVHALHQHLERAALEALRALRGHLHDDRVEAVEAVRLDEVGHLVVPGRGGRVGARRVRGGVDAVKAHLAHQRLGGQVLLLALAWEPHDHVARDGGVGHVAADVVDDGAVALVRVAALHLAQDVVVAALEGDVEELAQLGQLRARAHQAVREVARVRGGEADALDAGHVVHVAQQVGERPRAPPAGVVRHARQVAAVRVDVLPQQRHLLVPRLAQRQHLAPDVLRLAALLLPACERHYAVRALLVAAVDDVDPGGDVRLAARRGDVLQNLGWVGGDDLAGF